MGLFTVFNIITAQLDFFAFQGFYLFFFQLDRALNLTVAVLKRGLCVNQQPRCFLEGTVKRSKKKSPSQALGLYACPSCCSYRQLLPAHPEVSLAHSVLAEKLGHMLASVCSVIQNAL